jgi:hypothetical protein
VGCGPLKVGSYRDPKSNHEFPAALLKTNIAKAKSILPELSNFCCLPGRGISRRTSDQEYYVRLQYFS